MVDLAFSPFLERAAASLAYCKGFYIRGKGEFPGLEAWFDAMETRLTYIATRSDYYTHSHCLPPQIGGVLCSPCIHISHPLRLLHPTSTVYFITQQRLNYFIINAPKHQWFMQDGHRMRMVRQTVLMAAGISGRSRWRPRWPPWCLNRTDPESGRTPLWTQRVQAPIWYASTKPWRASRRISSAQKGPNVGLCAQHVEYRARKGNRAPR
jgi:hypothetical protein